MPSGEHLRAAVNALSARIYVTNATANVLSVVADDPNPPPPPPPPAPVDAWFTLGLRNRDDIGTRFDVLAQIFKNGVQIGQGRLNGVNGGSSGFAGASVNTMKVTMTEMLSAAAGDNISIRFSVRIAEGVAGHRSGTARLWYGDPIANTGFGPPLNTLFLVGPSGLSVNTGSGAKQTRDVSVDRLRGNPFKPFGTWSKTFVH